MTTSGETDLTTLLATMRPVLDPDPYVFVTTGELLDEVALAPRMRFEEAEGTTYIVTRSAAEAAGLESAFPCRLITLEVHSALDAVGFLARITTRLAGLGMGVNPVSGFFHDHLFVPEDRGDEAVVALREMAREAAATLEVVYAAP